MNKVIEKIKCFEPCHQLILLLSRNTINEEQKEYISQLINSHEMDWDRFLGSAFNNRLNGVIFDKSRMFKGFPREAHLYLELVYSLQKERSELHRKEIDNVYGLFEENNINYVFLKGAVLNSFLYEKGTRISNDTDILVSVEDLQKCINILEANDYIQGDYDKTTMKVIPATKKEKLFARMNTYEVVPLIKVMNNPFMKTHGIDINFKLNQSEKNGAANSLLNDSAVITEGGQSIRTLKWESFLIFLCIHLYREATMMSQIMGGKDLSLYKFLDIHFLISSKKELIDWKFVLDRSNELGCLEDVYYGIYYTEVLFPETLDEKVLDRLKPSNLKFMNQYKGREGSDEVYEWESDFATRVFSSKRKAEALKNLEGENERYKNIRMKLKE